MKLSECPSEHSSYGLHCFCIRESQSSQCCHCGYVFRKKEDVSYYLVVPMKQSMSSTGYTMEITIERLPSGNYIMRNGVCLIDRWAS